MNNHRIWNLENIQNAQKIIGNELSSFVQKEMYVAAVEHCLKRVLPLEENKNSEIMIVCYIISILNLLSLSKEVSLEYRTLVVKFEKIAKALLEKNNVRAGKSKLSFLHGQLKQGIASVYRSEGDTWAALWESSLGLFLSRGSADPILPFQHVSFIIKAIDRGFPMRVMDMLDEMDKTLCGEYEDNNLGLIRIKALRLSGQHQKSEIIIDHLIAKKGPIERLLWERHFSRAIQYGKTRELHSFLFGKNRQKQSYLEAYLLYAFWMKSQPKKIHSALCPKVASLKRLFKWRTNNIKIKKIFKVLSVIEEAYDVNIPFLTRVNKIGRTMPIIESLEAEYRILALACIVRFFNQRQKQMASIFHGEYQSQSLKMSEGKYNDIFHLFTDSENLNKIKPFYDTLRNEPSKNSIFLDGPFKNWIDRTITRFALDLSRSLSLLPI